MEEIEFLKQNLSTNLRGEAITNIKNRLSEMIESFDLDTAYNFFIKYEKMFVDDTKILNIISDKFTELLEKCKQNSNEFKILIGMHSFERFYWFQNNPKKAFLKGYIAEQLSIHTFGVGKILQLREARAFYRKAHLKDDIIRVQQELTKAVKEFEFSSPVIIGEMSPATLKLKEITKKCLNIWVSADNEKRFVMLTIDFAGIRPSPYDKNSISNEDPLLADFMTECGIVQKVNLSGHDGRVNVGNSVTTREEIHNDSQEHILIVFLNEFVSPILEWLKSKDETGSHVFNRIINSLQEHLDWDENITSYFTDGLTAWLSGYCQMALALWLPFFEQVLRHRLGEIGEDVINPSAKPGIEDFVVFENLLKKASNYYDVRTITYWNKLFSTINGLGWNLRNSFCHGALPLNVLKQDVIGLAVLIAFMYLLQKPVENSNE